MSDHSKLKIINGDLGKNPNEQTAEPLNFITCLQDFFDYLNEKNVLYSEDVLQLKTMLKPIVRALSTTLDPKFIIQGWNDYQKNPDLPDQQIKRWGRIMFGQETSPLPNIDLNRSFWPITAVIINDQIRFPGGQLKIARVFFLLLYMFELQITAQLEAQKTQVRPTPLPPVAKEPVTFSWPRGPLTWGAQQFPPAKPSWWEKLLDFLG